MSADGKENNNRKRSIIIAALILFTAVIVYKILKYPLIENKVETTVEDKSKGLYSVSYDSIYIDEVGGNLLVRNIYLKPDTALQLKYIANKDTNAAKVLYNIYVPLLKVINFRTSKALLAKELQANSIFIENPQILVWFFPGVNGKPKPEQNLELYKQILGKLKLIKVDSIQIKNAQVTGKNFFTKETKFSTNRTSVELADVLVDSTYKHDTTRILFCKQIEINIENAQLGEKNNYADLKSLVFNTRDKILKVGEFDYDGYKNEGFFKGQLRNLIITGIDWRGPLEKSSLAIDKVLMQKAAIEVKSSGAKKNKNSKYGKPILTGWINMFDLHQLQVNNISYKGISSDAKKRPLVIENNKLFINNVHLESTSRLDESLINQIKELDINNDRISIVSEDKLYNYEFKGFHFNTSKSELLIKEFSINPLLGEGAFADKVYYVKDRYDARIRNIKATDINLKQLALGGVSIKNVETSNSSFKVYRDKSRPSDTLVKPGSFPHQLLYRMPVSLKIDKLIATDSYIEYKEKNALSNTSGTLNFNKTDLTITNINNRPIEKGSAMRAKFRSLILGTVPMNAEVVFYHDDITEGKFYAYSNINQRTDLKILNAITRPMALIRIEDGFVDSLSVRLAGNNHLAKGSLTTSYSKLRISMLKKPSEKYNKSDLKSLVGNLVIKNGNINRSKSYPITYTPTSNKSFFNFFWKATQTGIKNATLIKL